MKYNEEAGNSRESTLAYERQMVRMAQQFVRFDTMIERLFDNDMEISGMSIRVPSGEGEDYFVVVRARIGNDAKVGFNSDATFAGALRGTLARIENGSMRWKDDDYANDKG
jgi:hypothetical protein